MSARANPLMWAALTATAASCSLLLNWDPEGVPCGPGSTCAEGFFCNPSTALCQSTQTPADGGPRPDGGPDAGPPDGGPVVTPDASVPTTGPVAAAAMAFSRSLHVALRTGDRVMVVGGENQDGFLSVTEVYDPATNTWSVGPSLPQARTAMSATNLIDGGMLVVGGLGKPDGGAAEARPEAWVLTPNSVFGQGTMQNARYLPSATLLQDGTVLVVGSGSGTASGTAERLNPNTSIWSVVSSPTFARSHHTGSRLPSGEVLVIGGTSTTPEAFNPNSAIWVSRAAHSATRFQHTTSTLSNGKLLVVGGRVSLSLSNALNSVELYDPGTGAWSPAGTLTGERSRHTATVLNDGRVLVAGGFNSAGDLLSSVELYDPVTQTWDSLVPMLQPRADHAAVLLPDGSVLLVGGKTANCERYIVAP